jgi:hypothetical protein
MTKAADLALGKIAAVKTALIEFTDGDDAIAVADAGVVTLLTTAVAKSEGGAVTTNISQGVAKSWIHFEGDGTISISDSFNVTSITDRGAGLYTITIANDMSNTQYSITGNGVHDANAYVAWCAVAHDTGMTAAAAPVDWLGSNDTPRDIELAMTTIHGDLA